MYNNAQRQEIYKIYVSDALRIIAENTAKFSGGSYLKKRYIDLIGDDKNNKNKNLENKSAREIIDKVVNDSGIKVVKSSGCI